MALTRKMLKAMSIEDEKIEQIIEAHTETTNALKEQRDAFKADADTVSQLQQELESTKAKLDDAAKNSYKAKYDEVVNEFNTYKDAQKAKETHETKAKAYRGLLKDAGVADNRIDTVLKVSDIDGLQLDDKGNIKDVESLSENIKTEWSDFIATTSKSGANVSTPPATGGQADEQLADFRKAVGLD